MASPKREKLPDWPKDMGGLDLVGEAKKKAKNQDEEEHELVLTQVPLRQPRTAD
jgi:hypothetical protein